MSSSDRAFLHNFSLMIGALAAFAVVLIVLATYIYGSSHAPADPLGGEGAVARLQPIGDVYAGDTGRAKMMAAKAAAAEAAAARVAYGGTTDGAVIYDKLCTTCHTAGVTGAPIVGKAADWNGRIAQGMDVLVRHAIDGYTGPDGNIMPPKGGNPSLTDEQVANTVKWMVAQVK